MIAAVTFLVYCFVAGGILVLLGIRNGTKSDLLLGLAVWLTPFLAFALS